MILAEFQRECALHKFLRQCSKTLCFFRLALSARFYKSTTVMEVRRVDTVMKLNMLAACAAFVFVGAILLGAF